MFIEKKLAELLRLAGRKGANEKLHKRRITQEVIKALQHVHTIRGRMWEKILVIRYAIFVLAINSHSSSLRRTGQQASSVLIYFNWMQS